MNLTPDRSWLVSWGFGSSSIANKPPWVNHLASAPDFPCLEKRNSEGLADPKK